MTSPETSFVLPSPEEVKSVFAERYAQEGSESALGYLHGLAMGSGHIRAEDLARNVSWETQTPYGRLEITVNLAKPEKDPRAIAAAAQEGETMQPEPGLPEPQCAICWENEGWPGSEAFPAKPQLRIAGIELGGEPWGLQYSPYAYFPEHCIALSREHRPMKISRACFARLLDFVDLFPSYFIGSNADLPIVGGSILSHDHFQGGRHVFPLMQAETAETFPLHACPGVRCGTVHWPASVVRLESADRAELLKAACLIHDAWRSYADDACAIQPRSEDGTPHSTVSPIARKQGGAYIMDLVLRNNRTSEERPWGLFHPRQELHHIKKENIGLIEIMGRAILPGRLAREIPAVQQLLHIAASGKLNESGLASSLYCNGSTEKHADWALELFDRRKDEFLEAGLVGSFSSVMQEEIGQVFLEVLKETDVFKHAGKRTDAWKRFFAHVNE